MSAYAKWEMDCDAKLIDYLPHSKYMHDNTENIWWNFSPPPEEQKWFIERDNRTAWLQTLITLVTLLHTPAFTIAAGYEYDVYFFVNAPPLDGRPEYGTHEFRGMDGDQIDDDEFQDDDEVELLFADYGSRRWFALHRDKPPRC